MSLRDLLIACGQHGHKNPQQTSAVQEVMSHLRKNPGAAASTNGHYYPLHIALFYAAPAKVIEVMLAAYPNAARETFEYGEKRGDYRDYPLSLALMSDPVYPANTVMAVLEAHPAAVKEANISGNYPLHCAVAGCRFPHKHRKVAPGVIAAVLAAYPAAAKEANKLGKYPLHIALEFKHPANTIAALLAAHPAAAKGMTDALHIVLRYGEPGMVPAVLAALPDGDPGRAVQRLSEKHGRPLDLSTLASTTALFVGVPLTGSPAPAFRWIVVMLKHAPADRHVKAAILQMFGNCYSLTTSQADMAALCFALLKATAVELLDRGPTTLHAHANEHGTARDIGTAELRNATTSQTGILDLLEPWFVDEVTARSSALFVQFKQEDAMLAVLCVFGHVVTEHLKKAHPELGVGLGNLLWADPKTVDRMRIKWGTEYFGDFGALLDFVRFSLTSPDQATQEKFLAPMLPDKGGRSKCKFTVRRIKSTHSDPNAQVKQCLVNLDWNPGIKFGKLLTKDALAVASATAAKANQGVPGSVWNLASEMLSDKKLSKKRARVIIEAQLYLPFFLSARKGVHIFYKSSRAKGLTELAQDCAKYATNAEMAFAPKNQQTLEKWKLAAARRLRSWADFDLEHDAVQRLGHDHDDASSV